MLNGISPVFKSTWGNRLPRRVSVRRKSFVDLFSGVGYDSCPVVFSVHWAQLLRCGGKCCFRVRDSFNYGFYYPENERPRDYGFFMLVKSLGGTSAGRIFDSIAAYVSHNCLLACDNEKVYWLVDVHEDGSIDVVDRFGVFYHVTEDGGKVLLDRNMMMDKSMALLKEIDSRYPVKGGTDSRMIWSMKVETRLREIGLSIEGKLSKYGRKIDNG